MSAGSSPAREKSEVQIADHALDAMDRGWQIFPVNGKVPATAHGLRDASSSHDRIHTWWGMNGDRGIGLATGPSSGLWALDIDGPEAVTALQELQQAHGKLPPTITSKTPRGHHLLFKYPAGIAIRNSAGKLGPKIDVRGEGGYIVLPPSPHPDGERYRWLEGRSPTDMGAAAAPAWLLELATAGTRQEHGPAPAVESEIGAGERNQTLASLAGTMRRRGMGQPEIEAALAETNARRCVPPLDEAEVRAVAKSIARYPAIGPGRGSVGAAIEVVAPTVTLAELRQDSSLTEPVDYGLRPYTARGVFALLTSPPKVGKSYFTGAYAHARVTGGTFLEQSLSPGPVLLVPPDEPIRAVLRRHLSLGTPGENLHIWDTRADPRPTIAKIAARAAEIGAVLVLVDTLPRIARIADENDNAAWNAWFTENDHYIRTSDCEWLFTHHDRKSGGKSGEGIRGASAIFGCVDIAFSMQRDDGDNRRRRILRIEGSRFDEAEDLAIELDDDGIYRAVGDVRTIRVMEDEELGRVRGVLTPGPAPVSELLDRLESSGEPMAQATLRRLLDKLESAGFARCEGEGGRGDPYRFASFAPRSTPLGSGTSEQTRSTLHAPNGASGASPEMPESQGDTRSTPGGASEGETLHADSDLASIDGLDRGRPGPTPRQVDRINALVTQLEAETGKHPSTRAWVAHRLDEVSQEGAFDLIGRLGAIVQREAGHVM